MWDRVEAATLGLLELNHFVSSCPAPRAIRDIPSDASMPLTLIFSIATTLIREQRNTVIRFLQSESGESRRGGDLYDLFTRERIQEVMNNAV